MKYLITIAILMFHLINLHLSN